LEPTKADGCISGRRRRSHSSRPSHTLSRCIVGSLRCLLVEGYEAGAFGRCRELDGRQAAGFRLKLEDVALTNVVVIFASTNLVDWNSILTNLPVPGSLPLLDPAATNFPRRFYRAVVPYP